MKRQGNLIPQIADLDNLQWAFWKAKRGKSAKEEVIRYQRHLYQNLKNLQAGLLRNDLSIGDYHYFKIYDPKERQICAASFQERVLHHAIMNVCHGSFEQFQVYDSYATRVGKGTEAAIKRAATFQRKYKYFLKIDCRKYFDSIDHLVLKKQLVRRFKDPHLLALFYQIIDSYETEPGKGLPIGNLSSQYFANHYLAHADRFLLQTMKVPAMVRYMDDLLIWHNSAKDLQRVAARLGGFCKDRLALGFKHCYQNKTKQGVSFLGVRLFSTHIALTSKNKKKLENKYTLLSESFDKGELGEQEFHNRLVALFVRPRQVRSYGFRHQMLWSTG